jgi:rubrerythrin
MGEKTEANLQQAFAGESQANRRYLFFGDKADKEGLPQVARLFRAAAEAETVHAYNHFNAMTGIGSSVDNLSAAVIGEHQEFTRMYPSMIDQAVEDQADKAQTSFEWANTVEQIHYNLFQEMLKAVKEKQSIPNASYYVCPLCGNTVLGQAPDKCPICGTLGKKFKKIE